MKIVVEAMDVQTVKAAEFLLQLAQGRSPPGERLVEHENERVLLEPTSDALDGSVPR